MTNSIWIKQFNTVKVQKAFHNYVWHAQISNTRCPLWQISDMLPVHYIMANKYKELVPSPTNYEDARRKKKEACIFKRGAQKLSKMCMKFLGRENSDG